MNPAPLDDQGLPPGYPFRPGLELTPRQAAQRLQAGTLRLIDCRTRPEWDTARVPGAEHVPLDQIADRAHELEGGPVAVICHHGVRSLKAVLFLRDHGLDDALSVAGGIDLWSLAVDPSVPRYERDASGCRRLT